MQTMSQLEAENARLKLAVQETREALDQSKTVEVRTILFKFRRPKPWFCSVCFPGLKRKVAMKCELFFAGSVAIWILTFPKQDM